MRGLYPIVDIEALERVRLDCVAFAEAVLAARPALLQVRAKRSNARDTLELLRAIRPHAQRAGTKLYANDRPDLALLAGADGVHLGQSDLPAEEVRRCFPKLELGISTHTLAQLHAALKLAPHYVAYGPVFATASKAAPEPTVGLSGLAQARSVVGSHCPLVAIGGINLSNASAIARQADLGAVIAELVDCSPNLAEVKERALTLHEKLCRPVT